MNCIINNISGVIYVTIFALNIFSAYSIWPPPYKVNLSQEETFVISELLDRSDVQDVYDEEELIKRDEMEQMNIKLQNDKFYRIHQQTLNKNEQMKSDLDFRKKTKVLEEFNPNDEPLPWKAGIVNEDGEFVPGKEIIYFDEEAKATKATGKQKRQETQNENEEEHYDYANFKAEYDNNVKMAQKAKDTVKYSTVKEEESAKDSLHALIDFKETPRNCTAEETKGIGMGAVECFWMDLSKPKTKNRVFENALRVFVVWIVVYVIVAIPCWCQYGWCCCCCRFKFCRPKEQIDEIKRFTVENPVGVFHDGDGNRITYKPTAYERYAQNKLDREIERL